MESKPKLISEMRTCGTALRSADWKQRCDAATKVLQLGLGYKDPKVFAEVLTEVRVPFLALVCWLAACMLVCM